MWSVKKNRKLLVNPLVIDSSLYSALLSRCIIFALVYFYFYFYIYSHSSAFLYSPIIFYPVLLFSLLFSCLCHSSFLYTSRNQLYITSLFLFNSNIPPLLLIPTSFLLFYLFSSLLFYLFSSLLPLLFSSLHFYLFSLLITSLLFISTSSLLFSSLLFTSFLPLLFSSLHFISTSSLFFSSLRPHPHPPFLLCFFASYLLSPSSLHIFPLLSFTILFFQLLPVARCGSNKIRCHLVSWPPWDRSDSLQYQSMLY